MAREQSSVRAKKYSNYDARINAFRASIRDGRVYECVSCHRLCFHNGVTEFLKTHEDKLEEAFPNIVQLAIGYKETSQTHGSYHICYTCKNYISRGKIPPMSNQNNLQLVDISKHEELQLTELENSMIALNIIFQKVFKLPKSRWPAMKDKTVNIPIFETDVLNTVKSLPRTPRDAGIIPINLKRKLEYKNSHMTQYISVPKLIKALNTLKEMGNPYYQFIPMSINFADECRDNDLEGFQFIYPEDEIHNNIEEEYFTLKPEENNTVTSKHIEKELEIHPFICPEDEVCEIFEDVLNEEEHLEGEENKEEEENMTEMEKEQEDYITHDPVKKWQFQYNQSTCFSNSYPEISYKEVDSERISVAPGEGKYPSNILEEKDWDLKSFPCLLPDGKSSLHSKREVKLSEQDYFVQRIMNKDVRFACNPAYIFAACSYIEKKQIQGRKGISFKRGKASKLDDGTTSYALEDPYSVLDNVKNTPRY